jgi:uncharacterized protein YutE (UPF0331/DUF86 family)
MDISRLNLNRVESYLATIQGFLAELREFSAMSQEEFLADKRNPAATESYLRRCLEAVFDLSRHILAKSYGFKELEYKKIASTLGEKGIVDPDFAGTLVKMAGYRNRMVHLYNEIGPKELYEIIEIHLSDIDRFTKEIVVFLKKAGKIS